MKTKKNKDYYVERAKEALRTLVIYFDITRPMNSKAYKVDGKFSITAYKNQMKFLAEWKKRDPQSKKKLAALYDRVLSAYNYNQGIPSELIQSVCGLYFNEDGRRVRVPLTEVVDALVADGFIRPRDKQPKGGAKFNKGDDGTYTKKCWWANKYLLANERRQYAMMGDKRYMSIETFPKPSDPVKYQGYRLARNVIFKWIKNTKMKKSTEDKHMTMDELREEVLAEVAKAPPVEDVKMEPERVETLDELVNGWNTAVKNTPPKPSPKPIPAPTPTPTRTETPQSAPERSETKEDAEAKARLKATYDDIRKRLCVDGTIDLSKACIELRNNLGFDDEMVLRFRNWYIEWWNKNRKRARQ